MRIVAVRRWLPPPPREQHRSLPVSSRVEAHVCGGPASDQIPPRKRHRRCPALLRPGSGLLPPREFYLFPALTPLTGQRFSRPWDSIDPCRSFQKRKLLLPVGNSLFLTFSGFDAAACFDSVRFCIVAACFWVWDSRDVQLSLVVVPPSFTECCGGKLGLYSRRREEERALGGRLREEGLPTRKSAFGDTGGEGSAHGKKRLP